MYENYFSQPQNQIRGLGDDVDYPGRVTALCTCQPGKIVTRSEAKIKRDLDCSEASLNPKWLNINSRLGKISSFESPFSCPSVTPQSQPTDFPYNSPPQTNLAISQWQISEPLWQLVPYNPSLRIFAGLNQATPLFSFFLSLSLYSSAIIQDAGS